MMRQSRLLKNALLGLVVGSMLIASANAASNSRTLTHRVKLPGVDRHGNLSLHHGGHAKLKLVYDTHARTFCAKAKATVYNYSGRHQTYYDRLAIALRPLAEQANIPLNAIVITKDEYKVDRGFFHCAYGKALLCGRVRGYAS